MSIYLGVKLGLDSIAILFIYNYYYAFKKESRYVIVVEKEKNVISDKGEIYTYSNVNKKSV